ncbi:unnamed protein product, partial [Meganyctiphanes norvegica]
MGYRIMNSEANARRIAMVESCFGASGQPLNVPGRVLVGEGVLTKMCRKKPKPRQFFLFNDILVYGNIVLNKKKYNKQHVIPLEEVQLSSLEDDGRYKKNIMINSVLLTFTANFGISGGHSKEIGQINFFINLRSLGTKPSSKLFAVLGCHGCACVALLCRHTHFKLL